MFTETLPCKVYVLLLNVSFQERFVLENFSTIKFSTSNVLIGMSAQFVAAQFCFALAFETALGAGLKFSLLRFMWLTWQFVLCSFNVDILLFLFACFRDVWF